MKFFQRLTRVWMLGLFLGATACAQIFPTPKPVIHLAVVMPSSKTDLAFSQSMYLATQKLQAEMGGESALVVTYSDNLFKVDEAETAIREYARQGVEIIIAHGSQYGPIIQKVAPDFPKTTFAWGTQEDTFGLPNVYAYSAAAEQGGFVNGVLAAHLTRSKTIGITGPVGVGDAKAYVDGFLQGVTSVDPSIQVLTIWTGSFSDENKMSAAAQAQIAKGADILTGSSQAVVGSVNAAKAHGQVLWFGTQADQTDLAPDLVVASQVYDWQAMLKEIIDNRASGVFGGTTYTLTLKNAGLDIIYNPHYVLTPEIQAAGKQAVEKIKSGAIVVLP